MRFYHGLSIVLLLVFSVNVSADGIAYELATSAEKRKPMPPQPHLAPCPPSPPDGSISNCGTPSLEELKIKYLQTEDHADRGLNFYYFASDLSSEYKLCKKAADHSNSTLDKQTVFDELGFPDYRKQTTLRGETCDEYAYLFDYKGDKDYLLTVYTNEDMVRRVGYTETSVEIDGSRRKFQD